MSAVQKGSKRPEPSTFAERFEFARDRQRVLGAWQEDQALAAAIGVSKASISEYKKAVTAPPTERTLALAQQMGVDPGWLAFGEQSAAPTPEGFATWFARRRERIVVPVMRNPPALTAAEAKKRGRGA